MPATSSASTSSMSFLRPDQQPDTRPHHHPRRPQSSSFSASNLQPPVDSHTPINLSLLSKHHKTKAAHPPYSPPGSIFQPSSKECVTTPLAPTCAATNTITISSLAARSHMGYRDLVFKQRCGLDREGYCEEDGFFPELNPKCSSVSVSRL